MAYDQEVSSAALHRMLDRIESLEQSRAAQANELESINNQLVDIRSGFTQMRNDDIHIERELKSRAEQLSDRIGATAETLHKLIRFQDTAIESLDDQYKRIALSQDNDRASVIRGHIDHTQKLTDLREAIATQLETMHKRIDAQRNAPGWIHYVDADDLQKIIDKRVIEQLKRFASLFFVGEPSERRKNVSIQDGQGNEKSAPGFGIADYPQR